VNDLEITCLAVVCAIWFLIAQQVAIRKIEKTNDHLSNTLYGLAEGKLEVKLDTDGDVAIRLKPRKEVDNGC
jgi:hypothetical protein